MGHEGLVVGAGKTVVVSVHIDLVVSVWPRDHHFLLRLLADVVIGGPDVASWDRDFARVDQLWRGW